jgi:uncharacterized protein (TIGR02246 family)
MTSRANDLGKPHSSDGKSEDVRRVQNLIETWIDASMAGDVPRVLSLMTDDVVFMVPGREPFGKEEFASSAGAMKDARLEAKSDIEEIRVLGDWAFCRTHLRVTITPPNGRPVRRSGYTMSILERRKDGTWALARDANLLATES